LPPFAGGAPFFPASVVEAYARTSGTICDLIALLKISSSLGYE